MSWNASYFAEKARGAKVLKKLAEDGTLLAHWHPACVGEARETLSAEGEHESVELLQSFLVLFLQRTDNITGAYS
jgi:hypothetical protein